jgi:hypothetical protein
MTTKRKFKVKFYLPTGGSDNSIIECRECTISENAYTFWGGEYGKTNYIVASYPIKSTIITDITNG